MQFLPQDVAFSIHLSDNRFTARPLSTTVVSPPRKWAPWVDISSPQPASARFFAKCPLRCLCFLHSVIEQLTINWCRWDRRWESSQMSKKNICRTVTKDILIFRCLSPLACHIALSGPVKLWDPLMIYQPNAETIYQTDPHSAVSCLKQRIDQTWNLPVTLSRYPF